MASPMPDELAPYEIKTLEELPGGSGGFGYVYLVKTNGVGVLCIAKRLRDILVDRNKGVSISERDRAALIARFRQECILLSRLRHPNIVQFIGVHYGGQARDDDLTLVMEWLYTDLNRCLMKCVREGRTISLPIQLSILLDVTYGLLYLHSQTPPIIHCDVSAENVLLTHAMKAKLCDFGAAKILDLHPLSGTRLTTCPGTLGVMPPEALVENPVYDMKLDDFSFGTMVLHVTNHNFPMPFEVPLSLIANGEVQIVRRMTSIRKMGKQHCLYDLVIRCLQDDPHKRPTSAEISATLEQLCSDHPKQSENVLELHQQMERLSQEELDVEKEANESLQQRLMESELRVQLAEHESQQAHQQLQAVQKEVEAKESENQQLTQSIEILKSQEQSLTDQLEGQKKELSAVEGEHRVHKAANQSLQKQLVELELRAQEAEHESQQAHQQLQAVQKEVEAKESENQQLTQSIENLKSQEQSLTDQLEGQKKELSAVEGEHRVHKAANQSLQKQLVELESRAQEAERESQQAKQESQQAKQESWQAKCESQQAKQESQQAKQESWQAKCESQQAKQESQQAKQESWQAKCELQQAKCESQQAKQESWQAKCESQQAKQESWQANQQLQRVQRESDELTAAIEFRDRQLNWERKEIQQLSQTMVMSAGLEPSTVEEECSVERADKRLKEQLLESQLSAWAAERVQEELQKNKQESQQVQEELQKAKQQLQALQKENNITFAGIERRDLLLFQERKKLEEYRVAHSQLRSALSRQQRELEHLWEENAHQSTHNHDPTYPGVCFFGDPLQESVDSNGRLIQWPQVGVELDIPPGAVPSGEVLYLSIWPCLSGPYVLPPGWELASPVFLIKTSNFHFKKPVKLSLTHYARLSTDEDCDKMAFVSSRFSPQFTGRNQEYHFRVLDNGHFREGENMGTISVTHFCAPGIARKLEAKVPSQWRKGYSLLLYHNKSIPYKRDGYAVFAVSLCHPLYMENLKKDIKEQFCGIEFWLSQKHPVQMTDEAVGVEYSQAVGGWRIKPDRTLLISQKEVNLPDYCPELCRLKEHYPPRILLTITSPQEAEESNCTLRVLGVSERVEFHMQLKREKQPESETSLPSPHAGATLGERPTLRMLLAFPAKEKKLNIPELIGPMYTHLGIFLLEDDMGTKVRAFRTQYRDDAETINIEILTEWIRGRGKQPVIWRTLVEVLREIQLNGLADSIAAVK